MKFDHKEIKVLSYLHMRANSPISEVAHATGLKSHTVRYVLDSLNERGILQPFVMVNRKCLGFDTATIYFSIRSSYSDHRTAILDAIKRNPLCNWLSPLVGDFEFGLALTLSSLVQIHQFFDSLSNEFGHFWEDRIFSIDKAWYYLGRKYLLDRKLLGSPLIVTNSEPSVKVDSVDQDILKTLVSNPLCAESLISKQLNIPSSTVNSRIEKLEEKGIIGGYVYGMYYSKANISSYRIIIDFGGMSDKLLKSFLAYSIPHPNIVSFNLSSGCYDLEMSVEFQGTQAIQEFLVELRETFKNYIVNLRVLGRMDDLKWVMI